MSEQWIVVRNWERFQHYRDRDPVWIKVYTALDSDEDFLRLTLAQQGLLLHIWIAFARHRGTLTTQSLRRRLNMSGAEARHFVDNLESLIHAGFIEVSASRPLALRYTREEKEKEEEKRREDSPLTPRQAGGVDNHKTSRARGSNPRSQRANPRAVTEADRVHRHEDMVAAAWKQSESWEERRTDLLHERLDVVEREFGGIFTDQEREAIIDELIGVA